VYNNMSEESASPQGEPGGVTPFSGKLPGGKFLTVAEVASILRLSKMSVYRLIHSGQLEAVQFGRSFRVPEKSLNAYLEAAYFDAG
jgi:excisionase family DNA binding protein